VARGAAVGVAGLGAACAFGQAGSFDPPYSGFGSTTFSGLSFSDSLSGNTLTLTITDTSSAPTFDGGTSLTNFFGVFLLDASDTTLYSDLTPLGLGSVSGPDGGVSSADQLAINSWNFGIKDNGGGQSTYGVGNGSTNGGTGADQVKHFSNGDVFTFQFTALHPGTDLGKITDFGLVTYIPGQPNGGYVFRSTPAPTPEPITLGLGVFGLAVALRRVRAK